MKWIFTIIFSLFISTLYCQDTKTKVYIFSAVSAQFDPSAATLKGEENIRFGENRISDNQLVHPHVHWIERETYMTSPNSRTTRYKFSEVEYTFDDKEYRELLYNYDELNDDFEGTGRYFREEDQRVYEYAGDREYLMYDFNPEDGQVITLESLNWTGGIPFEVTLDYYDPIELMNGEMRNVLGLICPSEDVPEQYWIEGIGSPLGFLDAPSTCFTDRNTQLRCFFRNDTLLYKDHSIAECWLPSSVNEVVQPEIDIWPNPTNNQIQIETKIPFDKVRVISSIGTQVKEFSGNTSTVNMSDLLSGLYYLQIEQKGQVIAVEKIIKID